MAKRKRYHSPGKYVYTLIHIYIGYHFVSFEEDLFRCFCERGGGGNRGLKLDTLEGGSFETRKTDIHTPISFCASSTLLHHVSMQDLSNLDPVT